MSFNIWSASPLTAPWVDRRERVTEVIERHEPDLAGFQEATLPTIRDLHERLPHYRWVGVGRDDGREGGEFAPIFYHAGRFSLLDSSSFWLAADCDHPLRGWDAACCRIVTWASLVENASSRRLVHLNTHLDHLGRRARRESARLLLRKAGELAGADPVVMTGDFNCREASAPYRILTGKLPFASGDSAFFLRDTFYESARPPEGPRRTFRGLMGLFGLGRIDYIFVKSGFRTLRHTVIDDSPPSSDHRPVIVELAFAADAL